MLKETEIEIANRVKAISGLLTVQLRLKAAIAQTNTGPYQGPGPQRARLFFKLANIHTMLSQHDKKVIELARVWLLLKARCKRPVAPLPKKQARKDELRLLQLLIALYLLSIGKPYEAFLAVSLGTFATLFLGGTKSTIPVHKPSTRAKRARP